MVQDPPPKQPDVEAKRRASLTSLGCEVVPVASLAFTGLVVDYPGTESIAVISSENGVVGSDFGYTDEQIRLYRSQDDLPVIRNLGNALAMQVGTGKGSGSSSKVSMVSMQPSDLFSALKRVPQYADASFAIEEIEFDEHLRVSQTHIKEYKLLQVEKLIRELGRSGFDLFTPCQYRLSDGSFSIITPPVLEMTPQGPVIIEGHTRSFYMAQLGKDRFRAVVVRDVQEPLPVAPLRFSEMRIADGTMTATSILPHYDKRLFRFIETALHS